MPAPRYPTDPDGFRIAEPFPAGKDAPPPNRYHRPLRWLVSVLLVLFVGAMLLRSELANYGRRAMAEYYFDRAKGHFQAEICDASLAEVDRALTWNDQEAIYYRFRADLHLELKNVQAAIDDLGQVLDRIPSRLESARQQIYVQRSFLHLRRHEHTEALKDIEQAFELRSAQDAMVLNTRAYVRALCNVELTEALKDIEQALKWSTGRQRPAFTDTRGYVLFRLARYDEALVDIEEAIELSSKFRQALKQQMIDERVPNLVQRRELLQYDHDLAVMYHHRGEIHEQQGRTEQAAEDKRLAIEMGFSFESGVF